MKRATPQESSGELKNPNRAASRRALRACSECRTRKRRCNVLERRGICTNCLVDGLPCVVKPSKRLKEKCIPKRARPIVPYLHEFKAAPDPGPSPEELQLPVWHPLHFLGQEVHRLLGDVPFSLPGPSSTASSCSSQEHPVQGDQDASPPPPTGDQDSFNSPEPDEEVSDQGPALAPTETDYSPIGFAIANHQESCLAGNADPLFMADRFQT